MKTTFLAILLCLGLSSAPPVQKAQKNISITVHHIRSEKGMIRIGVYDRADTFNKEPVSTHAFPKTGIQNGELQCQFKLGPGKYAFSLLDDENGDNEMNYNFVGIPTEGFGFSRDAKIQLMSPPDFEDCALQVGSGKHEWRIKVRYF
ncbi:MAG: DUF2141 domain-containing protein [Bacteroidota bacterium]